MKKQKVQVEKYTVAHSDIHTILGLTANQKITDITAHHATNTWSININVETTETTELPVPTHKHS